MIMMMFRSQIWGLTMAVSTPDRHLLPSNHLIFPPSIISAAKPLDYEPKGHTASIGFSKLRIGTAKLGTSTRATKWDSDVVMADAPDEDDGGEDDDDNGGHADDHVDHGDHGVHGAYPKTSSDAPPWLLPPEDSEAVDDQERGDEDEAGGGSVYYTVPSRREDLEDQEDDDEGEDADDGVYHTAPSWLPAPGHGLEYFDDVEDYDPDDDPAEWLSGKL
jgi:hypothetical protein